MIILEISKNGKVISRAGGKHIEMIHASVSYLKDKNRIRLVTTGLNSPEKNHQEHVNWIEEILLKPEDKILIQIQEGDNPDTPVTVKSYGNKTTENEEPEFYCSFCGAKASQDVQVLLSQNANICHDCLRRHNPDKNYT